MKTLLACAIALLLAACADKPVVPDWQMNAHGSLERYAAAFMKGDARVEAAEFDRARHELAATADVGLVARAELTRCALRLASLVVEPCAGFEALRQDAPAAERAYADYLAGKAQPRDAALLPPAHRAVASGGEAAAVAAIADPLARLVAAGVLFETGRASPGVLQLAVDTASAHGWRRPLLAWLGLQAQRAESAGAGEEAARLRRRMALAGADLLQNK
ncbi:MAG: hypothetical protein HYX47_24665 [Burkholderiales bacterium]|nr:hypothetical protein [Burkholderiales bacterium]